MKSLLSPAMHLPFSSCRCACCAPLRCACVCCACVSLSLTSGLGCSDSPQDFAEVPLVARGTSASELEVGDDLVLTLSRADVAFGPLYVCAGSKAGANCGTARLEWRESAVVDTLDEEPTEIGLLTGVTGEVRSWMYDYGITSLLTERDPQILPAAQELGGVSFVVEGVATISGTEVPFTILAAVEPANELEQGIPVIRKSSSDVFQGEVTKQSSLLEVVFDPAEWLISLRRTDFEAAAPDCELGVDDSCEAVLFDVDSPVGGIVSQAMTSGVRPTFTLR